MINAFSAWPWIGGVNTSLNPATIPYNQLVRARNIVFGVRGSRKKRDGINFDWDDASNASESVIGLNDFWYGTSSGKTNKRLAVHSGKKIYSYNATSGARSADLFAGTAWSSAISTACITALNNLAIISVDGSGNVMKKYNGTTVADLGVNTATADTTNASPTLSTVSSFTGAIVGAAISGTGIPANTTIIGVGSTTITMSANATATASTVAITYTVTPPVASISRVHLGRLWTNDKTNVDRLHYSQTADGEVWGGLGDSGAIDIGVGDGDPEGITAIFPTFNGVLFVAKKTKLYKIIGEFPETFQVIKVSDSLGCVSHNSIATIDQSDIFFISEKGIHSLATTDQFGDFQDKYVSYDIQGTFNDGFVKSRLKYTWGAYLPNINSVAFAVTDNQFSETANNCIWLYNIPLKSWYQWGELSCQSLIVADDADMKRFYLGTNTARIGKSFNDTNYDLNTSGTNTAVSYSIKTGIIHPDQDPNVEKAFYYFGLFYQPQGTHQITVSCKIDNHDVQTLSFSETSSSALLGSTFTLGASSLGYEVVLAPYTLPIDGKGRGVQITIEQTGTDQTVEIEGFVIGWLPLGHSQETLTTTTA